MGKKPPDRVLEQEVAALQRQQQNDFITSQAISSMHTLASLNAYQGNPDTVQENYSTSSISFYGQQPVYNFKQWPPSVALTISNCGRIL